MPASCTALSFSSAAGFDGSEASTTVKASLPAGQPTALVGGVVGAGVVSAGATSEGVALVGAEDVGAGDGVEAVGVCESPGAACAPPAPVWAVVWTGACAVLPASSVTRARANATAAPASSTTIPTIAAGSRQLGGRW